MAEPATPPMDEILASIRRIIVEDPPLADRAPVSATPVDGDDVLELGEAPAAVEPASAVPATASPPAVSGDTLVSGDARSASQKAFAALAGLSIDPHAEANTLDGLVRELLRPMLKDWLDAHLPDMVERVVAREVARISGR